MVIIFLGFVTIVSVILMLIFVGKWCDLKDEVKRLKAEKDNLHHLLYLIKKDDIGVD